MPGAESTLILYSRVVSPTIPPIETSSAPLDIMSFMSSMGNHGSDNLLSSTQPTMENHDSGVLLLGMQSPVIEDGSDGRVQNEFFPKVRGIDIQGTPIMAANAALIAEQQESIHQQAEIVDVISDGNESEDLADEKSKGEGPSSGKGKGTDPCN
ncbi:uncharacterized protein ARMOST_06953 [Armillaria ostoyae]|uniref:Uncharacterized protein n=1 Tax=Armillaria ostoyae TaxID=47428 RepID=A0A284R4G4_ARMOS|nr:uncharacterized protein ARMOST_06953 [Armillaria ostoyae]